jgi:Ni,Fe-hydrogenase III large subunit/Ni,Fe-hydrogenase III component G
MNDPATLSERLDHAPGAIGPAVLKGGAWRVRVVPERLADALGHLLNPPAMTLLSIAGEDRAQTDDMRVHYLLMVGADLVHVESALPRDTPVVPSLASRSFPGSRFEREMRDLLGIEPAGHLDPRPLVRHGFWPERFYPLREDAVTPAFEDDGRPFPFTPVQGAGIYEIPVGPIHAGVIEPGHFRFSVLGETIVKMRARLYFTHKGTERLFAGRRPDDGVAIAERVSGDTAVGHTLAYCEALEAIAMCQVPDRAQRIRTVLLELERIYNHVTDAGAIVGDTGFQIGQAHCLRLRESLLRINKTLTGHRLLRGGIVPGGVTERLWNTDAVLRPLRQVAAEFEDVMAICDENTLVQDRLEGTGRLTEEVARDFGVVGYVARACGLADDVRADRPFAAYGSLGVVPVVETSGDVRARLSVRVREVRQSLDLIERVLASLAAGPWRASLGELPPFTAGFGVVEAWRGRLVHLVVADSGSTLRRVKVVDPSFFNWPALARALEDNIVPDFPLCNKSFNQSYSGNDL